MTGPCTTPQVGYTRYKRLKNAHHSGPAHRHRAFFVSAIHPGFAQSVSRTIGEQAGSSDRKALRRAVMRFFSPACSPALNGRF